MARTIVITGTASGFGKLSVERFAAEGDTTKVRYYTGPDGTAIPRVKQLLGQDWYWQEFRALVGGSPSPLWRALVPSAKVAPAVATPAMAGQAAASASLLAGPGALPAQPSR
jgi:NAD(P)-dependent dehydrogenase (short-subunit alcohol dehydrogenase family)